MAEKMQKMPENVIKDSDVQRHFVLQEKDVHFFSQSLADSVLLMRGHAHTHKHSLPLMSSVLCDVLKPGNHCMRRDLEARASSAEAKEAANDGKIKML